jgi:hypothetical protein
MASTRRTCDGTSYGALGPRAFHQAVPPSEPARDDDAPEHLERRRSGGLDDGGERVRRREPDGVDEDLPYARDGHRRGRWFNPNRADEESSTNIVGYASSGRRVVVLGARLTI